VVATGHGFVRVARSLITGRVIAELMAGGRTTVSIGPFLPRRFSPGSVTRR